MKFGGGGAISFGNNDGVRFTNVRSNNFDSIADEEQKKKNANGPMSQDFNYTSAFRMADPTKAKETAFQA